MADPDYCYDTVKFHLLDKGFCCVKIYMLEIILFNFLESLKQHAASNEEGAVSFLVMYR